MKSEDRLNKFDYFTDIWKGGLISPVWVFRLLRWIGLKNIVRYSRSRASAGLFLRLHHRVLHDMRTLGVSMEGWKHNEIATTQNAERVCTGCNELMCDLLELNNNGLHCCIKVLKKGKEDGDGHVETWVRSVPSDGRPDNNDEHLVSGNTVWSALLGGYDGKYNWQRSFDCFSCNDLFIYDEQFQSTRKNWKSYYRSTLVFPLRYCHFENGKMRSVIIGFLAFDAPTKNGFPGLPDIFQHRDDCKKVSDYCVKIKTSTIFHLGAIMADMLSICLRPAYEYEIEQMQRKGGK